jgi:hypothetical protein
MIGRGQFPATLRPADWVTNLHGIICGLSLLVIMGGLTQALGRAQPPQIRESGPGRHGLPPLEENHDPPYPMTAKQRRELMHVSLEKSKRDASELAALARQLKEELNKPNANSLSLESMNHIEKIARLAKKIREEIKGR